MSDVTNDAKRAPWTQDPDVVKAIWGENAQVSAKSTTAATRLVNQAGSLWPTEKELEAYGNNAMPSPHSFTTETIKPADVVVKPMYNTPVLSPIDGAQSLIDSVLGARPGTTTKAVLSNNPNERVPMFLNEEDLAEAEAEDDRDFGPDDGRNNIDDYDIDQQEEDEGVYGEDMDTETKEKIPTAKRKKLANDDFVLPKERKFPVTTPKGVMQAVNSWGRYEGDTGFATFKRNLIDLAKRKGFTKSLPEKWQTEMKSKEFQGNEIIINIEDSPISNRLRQAAEKMQSIINESKKS